MTTMWIGPFYDESHAIGERAFLVRKSHHTKGSESYELRDTPPKTNQSFAFRLTGWCGTYNDLATYGEGAVKVVTIAPNGRLKVEPLLGDDLKSMLEEFGFPELAD